MVFWFHKRKFLHSTPLLEVFHYFVIRLNALGDDDDDDTAAADDDGDDDDDDDDEDDDGDDDDDNNNNNNNHNNNNKQIIKLSLWQLNVLILNCEIAVMSFNVKMNL